MPSLALPPTLTLKQARAVSNEVCSALSRSDPSSVMTIDASALTELDTAALAVLLQARREAQSRGVSMVVEGAPTVLQQIAVLYGVDGLLGLKPA